MNLDYVFITSSLQFGGIRIQMDFVQK